MSKTLESWLRLLGFFSAWSWGVVLVSSLEFCKFSVLDISTFQGIHFLKTQILTTKIIDSSINSKNHFFSFSSFVLVVVLFFVWRCFCRKKQKPKRAIKYNAAGSTYHYKPPKAKPQKTQPSADVYNKNNASKTDMDGSSKIDFPLTKYSS